MIASRTAGLITDNAAPVSTKAIQVEGRFAAVVYKPGAATPTASIAPPGVTLRENFGTGSDAIHSSDRLKFDDLLDQGSFAAEFSEDHCHGGGSVRIKAYDPIILDNDELAFVVREQFVEAIAKCDEFPG